MLSLYSRARCSKFTPLNFLTISIFLASRIIQECFGIYTDIPPLNLQSFKKLSIPIALISVDDHIGNLSEKEIIDAMNIVLNADIFSQNRNSLVSLVGAKIVEISTTEFDLVL